MGVVLGLALAGCLDLVRVGEVCFLGRSRLLLNVGLSRVLPVSGWLNSSKPRSWITMWWWNQHKAIRFSGSVVPPCAQGVLWWISIRYRESHPSMAQYPSVVARIALRKTGGIVRDVLP